MSGGENMFKIALMVALAAQTGNIKPRTVWDGVYTADQAERGRFAFNSNCRNCHARDEDFAGGEAHALKGDVWYNRWREDWLQSLFNKMKGYMPPAKARLSNEAYLDVISYLLSQNGFPAGAQELKMDQLPSTRIEGKSGPEPLPNLAIAKIIGCLAPGPNNSWNLTSATEPARTRQPDESTPEEIKEAAAAPLGGGTFQLRALDALDKFDPAEHKGHRIMAKGALFLTQTPKRLSVVSLEVVATTDRKSTRLNSSH